MTYSLKFVERAPSVPTKGPAPLLVLLHGLGSNENDLFSFAPHLDARYRILSVRAPRTYGYGGFAWFDILFDQALPRPNAQQLAEARQTLLSFLEEIQEAYHPSRIYLAGFSQGAIMSYLTALTHPTLVSGVLAMSGYVIKTPDLPAVADKTLRALPIFATHGVSDQVLPVFLGRSTHQYLQSLRLNVTYREYPMGHQVSAACFEDCQRWLADQVADLP
ncbi:MAG: alpha/beta fold hydrolase [Tunicatimonas sp.]